MTGRNKEIDIVFDRDIKDSVIDNVLHLWTFKTPILFH